MPADARLIEASDLEVDESTLTGESLPVAKQVRRHAGRPLAERACMLYAATTVVAGTAVGDRHRGRPADPGAAGPLRSCRARKRGPVGLQAQLRELTDRAWPVSRRRRRPGDCAWPAAAPRTAA